MMGLAASGVLAQQGIQTTKWDVEIPTAPVENNQVGPLPPAEPIQFNILSSKTKRVEVTESPEMPELPLIQGIINLTFQSVAAPDLPEPPPPLPFLPPDDPAVVARLDEFRENHRGPELVFVSASVFEHHRSLVSIYPNGRQDGAVTVCSNIDFSHFNGGLSTCRVNHADGSSADFGLLIGLGNTDTGRTKERLAGQPVEMDEPQIPDLPDIDVAGPMFIVTEGSADSSAMEVLEQLHDLYRKEGERLHAEFLVRRKANEDRKAYLIANPPKPKDLTIKVWSRTAILENANQEDNR